MTTGVSAVVAAPPANAATAPLSGRDFLPADQNTHLLRRATFGATPKLLAEVRRKGRTGWLEEQLSPGSIDDSACSRLVRNRYPELSWTMARARKQVPRDHGYEYMVGLAVTTLMRAVWSRRQLFEVMCDFWSDHLHISSPFNKIWYSRHDYDRSVIRAHALGRFEDMLLASAQHPAMLVYLNNAESNRLEPNENYGRELLELHTVGVDAGYSEQEMTDSTYLMTGFGLSSGGLFEYHPGDHRTGPVSVLGFSSPNGSANGRQLGLDYLKHLANHPATARHLAFKLARKFVTDEPADSLVDALAQTYLDNGTSIKPVLRQLFASTEFADAVGQKTRRPMEDVVATMRILGLKPQQHGRSSFREMYFTCAEVGHAPFGWPLVNGYPDDATSWASASNSLNLWNRHLALAAGWYPRRLPRPPLRRLLPSRLPRTHGGLVDALAQRLVFRKLRSEHRAAVLDFLGVSAGTPLHADSRAVKAGLPKAVALILDSPYHGMR